MVNLFYKKLFIKFSVRGKAGVKILLGTEELCCLKNAGFKKKNKKNAGFLTEGVKYVGEG